MRLQVTLERVIESGVHAPGPGLAAVLLTCLVRYADTGVAHLEDIILMAEPYGGSYAHFSETETKDQTAVILFTGC